MEEVLSGVPEGRQAWQRPEGGGGGQGKALSILEPMELSRDGGWVGAWEGDRQNLPKVVIRTRE